VRSDSHDRSSLKRHAAALGVSQGALELYLESEIIDLHIDSYIWHRVFGYDLRKRHGRGLFGGLSYSQVDIPRALEAGLSGATWVITTNPLKDARAREETFHENFRELTSILSGVEAVAVCRTESDYWAARAAGKHAATIGIQGGNALDRSLESVAKVAPHSILRITLVHLSSSSIGCTSSPGRLGKDTGLTAFGKRYIEQLNALGIFVDLLTSASRASGTRSTCMIELSRCSYRTPVFPGCMITGATSTISSSPQSPTPEASWASCCTPSFSVTRSSPERPSPWCDTWSMP